MEKFPQPGPVEQVGIKLTRLGYGLGRQKSIFTEVRAQYHLLEDEFGHIPLMVFPDMYERHEHQFKSLFLAVRGKVSRREGTHNVVVTQVKPFRALDKVPQSKDWR